MYILCFIVFMNIAAVTACPCPFSSLVRYEVLCLLLYALCLLTCSVHQTYEIFSASDYKAVTIKNLFSCCHTSLVVVVGKKKLPSYAV